jgi:hypothetical protein
VKIVLPFLTSASHIDTTIYRFTNNNLSDEHDLAKTFPEATLFLFDALIADDRASIPYGLPKMLEIIAEADPTQRQSRAWRRLHDLNSWG